jgi:hypothetical protein
VGHDFADLLVEDGVLVALKATRAVATEHEAQLLNYLKATRLEVGPPLNFGPRPQVRRKIFDNVRKSGVRKGSVRQGGARKGAACHGALSWNQDKPK